jgi:hypothetical protein
MGKRRFVTGVLMAGAIASGGVAMASPAWADTAGAAGGTSTASASDITPRGCSLNAYAPRSSGRGLSGYGSRTGCGDTVTYFWVRVYKAIDWWPDSERAVEGRTYWRNGGVTARGGCDGRGKYYTWSSTATGVSGDDQESSRRTIC